MKLNFRLGSIPVSVHGSFLLVVAFLGFRPGDPAGLAQWMVVVFVGVLLHELGHALVGRSFGLTPQIDLIGFGGLTSWSAGDGRALSAAKRIAISLAGAVSCRARRSASGQEAHRAGSRPASRSRRCSIHSTTTRRGLDLTRTVFWVNAGWGAANLLPILPMDGGNVLFQSLNWLTKERGGEASADRLVRGRPSRWGTARVLLLGLGVRGLPRRALRGPERPGAPRGFVAREKDAPLVDVLKSGFAALSSGGACPGREHRARRALRATDAAVRSDGVRAARLRAPPRAGVGRAGRFSCESARPSRGRSGTTRWRKFERAARELGRAGGGGADRGGESGAESPEGSSARLRVTRGTRSRKA